MFAGHKLRRAGGAKIVRSVTYLGSYSDAVTKAAYDFNGIDLGPDTPNRMIIITSTGWGNVRNTQNIKLNGSNMIKQSQSSDGSANATAPCVAIRKNSGSTTGDIQVNYNGNVNGCVMSVFNMETGADAPLYQAAGTLNGASGATMILNDVVVDVDTAVFCAAGSSTTAAGNLGWTGVDNAEKQHDVTLNNHRAVHGWVRDITVASTTDDLSYTGASGVKAMAVISVAFDDKP